MHLKLHDYDYAPEGVGGKEGLSKHKKETYKNNKRSTPHRPQSKGGAKRVGASGASGKSNLIKAIGYYEVVFSNMFICQAILISQNLKCKTNVNGNLKL